MRGSVLPIPILVITNLIEPRWTKYSQHRNLAGFHIAKHAVHMRASYGLVHLTMLDRVIGIIEDLNETFDVIAN